MSSTNTLLRRRPVELAHVDSYMSASPVRISTGTFTSDSSDSHTDQLKCADGPLVTRRGSTIVLQISLTNSISCSYTVALTFIPVHGPRERSSMFKASGNAKDSTSLWLSIDLPTAFPIGYYDTMISVSMKGCAEVITHLLHNAIVVLFNPWNTDDDTFIEDEQQRQWYCLDDTGVIYRGTVNDPLPRHWIFGQFEAQCLDTALMLLKNLSANDRRSPSLVVREILSKVMPRDGSGLLLPCYTGLYGGGTHPCKWTGSTSIIQKYYRTRSPVKYGQCWIACGVGVSLLRSLGVPCRTVTCYEAAVPMGRTPKTMHQVHRYFTPEGNPVHELETDKIWSYHVLVECWMRRNDLSIGYDGWQVVDVASYTPSAGVDSVAGPVPVVAVKEKSSRKIFGNDINVLLGMIHSEVHYHRVVHSYATMSNRQCTLAKVLTNQCGQLLITSDSSNSSGEYIDLTTQYREDRSSFINDNRSPSPTPLYGYPPPSKDCSVELSCSRGEVNNNFDITITLSNNGPMVRTLDGRVMVMSTQYTGDNPKPIVFHEFSGKLTPARSATVELPVTSKQCLKHMTEQNILRIFTLVKSRETQQLFTINHYHCLRPPALSLTIKHSVTRSSSSEQSIKTGDNIRVGVSFRNTLTSSLSYAVFLIEGLGVTKEMSHRRVVLPGKLITIECPLKVNKPGDHLIMATMSCDKLHDITGSTNVTVQ